MRAAFLSTFIVVALFVAAAVVAAARAPLRLAILSDLHLDPFYGTSKGLCTAAVNPATNGAGAFGCDSPMDLVTAAISDINSATVGASYVVLTGDWLRHDMAEVANDTIYAFERVVGHIEQLVGDRTIPLPVVSPALGNNDFVPDYNFDVTDLGANTLLHNVSEILTNASLISANESTTFRECGYYRRIVTTSDGSHAPFMVIALNTIAWSVKIPQPAPASMEDPCGQFAFLQRALAEAQGSNMGAIILSHIPPALNWYSQLSRNHKAAEKGEPIPEADLYWQQRFSDRFVALVSQFKATVRLVVFGHTHRGAFTVSHRESEVSPQGPTCAMQA